MKKIFYLLLLISPVVAMLDSCKKNPVVQQNPSQQNKAPIANAGADQIIILPVDSVALSGSGTDADGRIIGYEWTKINGPVQYTLVNSTAAVTKLKDLVAGDYEFEFTVTDDGGLSAKDKLIVTVVPLGNPACNACWDY
jgi:K319L-like, PKD domain